MLEQLVEDCWVLTLNRGKRLYWVSFYASAITTFHWDKGSRICCNHAWQIWVHCLPAVSYIIQCRKVLLWCKCHCSNSIDHCKMSTLVLKLTIFKANDLWVDITNMVTWLPMHDYSSCMHIQRINICKVSIKTGCSFLDCGLLRVCSVDTSYFYALLSFPLARLEATPTFKLYLTESQWFQESSYWDESNIANEHLCNVMQFRTMFEQWGTIV